MADMGEEEGDWLDDSGIPDDIHPPEWLDARRRAGEAIEAGDDSALRRVLAEEPGLAGDFEIGESLLNPAAGLGRAGAVAALLEAGVRPDLINGSGGTPLMAAAANGHAEAARMLLEAGADPDVLVEDHCDGGDPEVVGRCALFFALAGGHRDVVDLLEPVTRPEIRDLAHRELPAYLDWRTRHPPPHLPTNRLFMAITDGHSDRLREAIDDGADVNRVLGREASNPRFGSTPLSFAAARGRAEMVAILGDAGADPGLVDHLGRTAADYAELNGHAEIAATLRPPLGPAEGPGASS